MSVCERAGEVMGKVKSRSKSMSLQDVKVLISLTHACIFKWLQKNILMLYTNYWVIQYSNTVQYCRDYSFVNIMQCLYIFLDII